MPKKFKRALIILGIIVITIILALLIMAIIDKKTLYSISNKAIDQMSPLELAFSISDTNDNARILELGKELFINRDRAEIKKDLSAESLMSSEAFYLAALIDNGDIEKYSNQIVLFTSDMIKNDSEEFFLSLFYVIHEKITHDTQERIDICENLISKAINFENTDNDIYYKAFLYYIGASIKSDKTQQLDNALKEILEKSNVDYNEFFEHEKLIYCSLAFEKKHYTVFENIFLESNNDEHECSSILISYLINSDLDVEDKKQLIISIEKLINQTDINNTNKINGLKGFLKILRDGNK